LGHASVMQFGLRRTLEHIKLTGRFPLWGSSVSQRNKGKDGKFTVYKSSEERSRTKQMIPPHFCFNHVWAVPLDHAMSLYNTGADLQASLLGKRRIKVAWQRQMNHMNDWSMWYPSTTLESPFMTQPPWTLTDLESGKLRA
jgi:hypothetical protein